MTRLRRQRRRGRRQERIQGGVRFLPHSGLQAGERPSQCRSRAESSGAITAPKRVACLNFRAVNTESFEDLGFIRKSSDLAKSYQVELFLVEL